MAALTDHHLHVLERIGAHLGAVTRRFALGGSALLAAHGLPVEVNDLDVIVWSASRDPVVEALAPLARFEPLPKHPPWTSDWLIGGVVAGTRVEVISELGYEEDGTRFAIPEATEGVVGSDFPLSALPYWYHLYAWYQPEKAELVKGVVPEAVLGAARREMMGST